jgi:molybdopterin-guanine dinucleotide biosynthesis protein B
MAGFSSVVGIIGWKNSGKTTLVTDLVRHFRGKGLTVSTVKHAHHRFDIDQPGKDSFQHREAGAGEVMIASDQRWALMAEHDLGERPALRDLVARMSPADVILAEGFKGEAHPKIEVHRDLSQPLIAREDSMVSGVVTPDLAALSDCPCPLIARDDIEAIGELVLRQIRAAQ